MKRMGGVFIVQIALGLLAVSSAFAGGLTPAERLDILIRRADDQMAAGKLDAALATAETATQIAPESALSWWLLGSVRDRRGEWAEAEEAFTHALARAPGTSALHHNLGWAQRMQGRLAEAVEHIRTAIRLDAGNAEARESYAVILDEMGWSDAAAEQRRDIVLLNSSPAVVAQAHNGLGYYHASKGRSKEALAHIRLAIAASPANPALLDSLGAVAALAGDYRNAEASLRRALAKGGPLCSHATLAFVLARQDRGDEALAELGKLGDLAYEEPGMDLDALYWAARALDALDRKADAAEPARALVKRWPKIRWADDMRKIIEAVPNTGGPFVPLR